MSVFWHDISLLTILKVRFLQRAQKQRFIRKLWYRLVTDYAMLLHFARLFVRL